MEKGFLKVGDIIRLDKGMQIGAAIPRKFCFSTFSDELYTTRFQIGDVLHKKVPDKEALISKATLVLRTLLDEKVNEKAVSAFVDSLELDFTPEAFDTQTFAGVYRVFEEYKVDANKVSVWCEKLDDPEVQVFFYQTLTSNGVQPYMALIEV